MKYKGVSYQSTVVRIDVDTGLILTEQDAKKHYQLIKTKKESTYADKHKTRRLIKWTKLYRNKRQLELF